MRNDLEFTILSDGSSDKMLIAPIRWLLRRKFPNYAININYADLRPVLRGNTDLSEKICKAIELFPCDILLIHRDSENQSYDERKREIDSALSRVSCEVLKAIPVIPCRMSEAWLLIDIQAIRIAVGNPNGIVQLVLPPINRLEKILDPKEELVRLLKQATELNRRRLKKFKPHLTIHLLSEIIEDYSILQNISAFQRLEQELEQIDI